METMVELAKQVAAEAKSTGELLLVGIILRCSARDAT
jgi:hypothetical protein